MKEKRERDRDIQIKKYNVNKEKSPHNHINQAIKQETKCKKKRAKNKFN